MLPIETLRPIRLAALALLLGCSAKAPTALPPESQVDSVLLVTVDTLRHDALGFAGNPSASTPTLDRLAATGVDFDRAYAHNVVTLPSHANILTGRLPPEHGVRDNEGFLLPDSLPTAASWLAARGFATAAFVAAFPLDHRFGLDRGFEVYDDRYPRAVGERPGDEVVAGAVDWWSANHDRRRFLWVHLYDPHAPYEPPGVTDTADLSTAYQDEVEAVDRYLEPLLEPILESGESTLVVFTADHGESLGEHGELTHGLFAYEAVLRVPLVLWAPGLDPGRRTDLAGHVDLLPTLLTAAGIEPPPALPGRDLLAGETGGPLYFESVTATFELGAAPLRGLLDGPYKLIELPLPELYDVVADPAESRNLVAERRDLARRLAAALPEEEPWPPRRDPAAPEAGEGLRALGYLGGNAPRRDSYGVEDDPKNLVDLQRRMQEAIEHLRRGRLAEAESLTREALTERADLGMAYHYLALILLAQERVPEAVDVMERSRQLGLASPKLLRQLGLSLAEVGRHQEARAILEPMAAEGDPRALHDLASALVEAGDLEAAESALGRLLERDPDDPEGHQTLALVELRTGRPDRARASAERAVRLDPGLSLAWSYLGEAAYQIGDRERALTAWERAVDTDPSNLGALYNSTVVAEELGETERLRRALERFLATAPPETWQQHRESVARRLEALGPG